MANRKTKWNREELIPIVMAVLLVLGFFLIQGGGITGLAVFESADVQTFEVNEVIPATATLEITSGTQKAEILLSEFTVKLGELETIQPILENNKLVAYNITNITIDLASYNIKPAESITIRFIEVYKEITKEITKVIPTEVIPEVVEENITEIVPEEEIIIPIPEIKEGITFDRLVTCDKCGQHKVPPSTYVNMTVSAISETLLDTTFAEYVPIEWIIINAYDGEVEYIGDGYKKITWNVENLTEISKGYIVQSPQKTTPPTDYIFKSELANITSEWTIKVADPFEIAAIGPVTDSAFTCNDYSIGQGQTSVCTGTYGNDGSNTLDDYRLWLEEDGAQITRSCGVNDLVITNIDFSGAIECQSEADGIVVCENWHKNSDAEVIVWTVQWCSASASNIVITNGDSTQASVVCDIQRDIVTEAPNLPPKVENRFPYNYTNSTTPYINFTYNVTDAASAIDTCQLWLQKAGTWTLNATNTTLTEGITNNTINITLEDSSLLWKVECNDTANKRGNSSAFNITIDSNPPLVNISWPANDTQGNVHSVNFTYNTSDAYIGVDNCSLYLKHSYAGTWERNKTDIGITETINNTFNITLLHENVYWKVGCYDEFAQQGNSSEFNYTVYNLAPVVNISIPKNDTLGYVHSVNFTYNVSGNGDDIDNCSLYLKHSYAGTWERNKTTTVSPVAEVINNTFNRTLLHENVYWKVGCYDEFALQENSSSFNYTVKIATPQVNISIPKNNTQFSNVHGINFTYNVTMPGPETPQACELWIDGSWNKTDYTITEGINQSFNISFDYGTYKWYVRCNTSDASDGWGTAAAYNFSTFEVTNVAPKVCCVRQAASVLGAQTINLDSWKSMSVTFNVSDKDGTDNLKAFGNFTGTGNSSGSNRYLTENISCVYTGKSNATSKEFNCSAKIWYWYKPGYWNFSVNATDSLLWAYKSNISEIKLGQTKAITIWPTTLTWTGLNVGEDNQTASNDPININNTGNYNVSLSYVNVTGYDLHGESPGKESEEIPAANFTVDVDAGGDPPLECDGTAMANKTSINIVNSMLALGNHSIGAGYGALHGDGKTGFENISFCLINVPGSNMITPGEAYSTAESSQWIIGIS